jgi:hypothetical protein
MCDYQQEIVDTCNLFDGVKKVAMRTGILVV